MTQATGQAPATASPVQTSPAAAPTPQTAETENVPQLLNRLQVVAVSVCLVFGVLAALVQFLGWQAGDRAADNTEQLVRVQDVETSLYRADALASNAFLLGGLEPAEQRADYDAAIERVLQQVTDAAEAQSADREALAALSAEISAYTTAVTQARDNNRQAFPVGAAYLREASDALRTGASPILDALVAANTERAVDEMDAQHPWWLLGLAVLAVAALWMVNRWIAKRFHRRFNVGLAIAAVAFAALTFFTVSYASSQNGEIEDLREGQFTLAVDEANARTAANDAKAKESQRLIARAATEEAEAPWNDAAAIVDENTRLRVRWAAYTEAHANVIALDNRGDWDGAVELATDRTRDGNSTTAFDEFDAASAAEVAEAGDTVTSELRSNGIGLLLSIVTLLIGLLGAAVAAGGVNQRRKEYA